MILKKSWVLQIERSVSKNLKKFPTQDSKHILQVIEGLSGNPFGGDIQKMKGEENVWRRRIGSYRIFYELLPNEGIIHVYHVERRTTQTY